MTVIKWNKTDDGLPEKPKYYLTWDDGEKSPEIAWFDGENFYTDNFCSDNDVPQRWAEIPDVPQKWEETTTD